MNLGPAFGLTKADHVFIVALRGRPVTADSMRPAKPDEDTAASRPSLLDTYTHDINRREPAA